MPMSSTPILSDSPPPSTNKDGAVPSGFILKLYQMVNGAPDDIISWTAAGDAFKIGADLNLLEAETLPKYFRHSRFQSLVRQLNFYNFRKVNRERTFWIYKHRLFHRDHPENLHMLRRRTCPGVDGRKNRFSTLPRKVGDEPEGQDENDEEQVGASDEESYDDMDTSEQMSKKRSHTGIEREGEKKQKVGKNLVHSEGVSNVVDISLLGAASSAEVNIVPFRRIVTEDDSGSEKEVDEHVARREQAHIVSQVAIKLEQYARKAKKGLGRTRGGGGIVTPPLGGGQLASGHYYRSVITYDDEYDAIAPSSIQSIASVSDVESQTGDESLSLNVVSPRLAKRSLKLFSKAHAPIENIHLVKTVGERIMQSTTDYDSKVAFADIACFCMSNPPDGSESESCAKILGLLSTCDKLAYEFMQYRYALHPSESSSTASQFTFCAPGLRNDSTAFSIHKIWERASTRRDAIKDFKTFAVNYINNDLVRMELPEEESSALRMTADVWLKSASVSA